MSIILTANKRKYSYMHAAKSQL